MIFPKGFEEWKKEDRVKWLVEYRKYLEALDKEAVTLIRKLQQ